MVTRPNEMVAVPIERAVICDNCSGLPGESPVMANDDTGLDAYRSKRTGGSTPEPMASTPAAGRGPRMFVVHQHDATRMHWAT